MYKGSAKALPLPLDLAAVSSSGHSGEYQLCYRCFCAGMLVRRTGTEHKLVGGEWQLARR